MPRLEVVAQLNLRAKVRPMFEVYCLTSPSGKSYVGFTSAGADKRWAKHVWDAENGSKLPLHRAIRKYGPKSFARSLLERMTTEAGAKRAEQLWIKELGTFGFGGYNATLGGDGVLGCKGNIGKVRSPETRAKMAAARLGKKASPETCAKLSESHRGKKASQETRAKMAAAKLGKKASPETCAKIGDIHRGMKHSPDTCAQMSESHSGKILSPEHRANISAALLGKPKSSAARANMSAAQQLSRPRKN